MSGVPYTFASATSSIPLSELDSNFATPVTIGTTSVTLGNTVTTLANVSLSNVTISSVASVIPNNFVANSSVIVNGTSNVAIASANGAVTMVTNGNTAVTIDTAQNVGIGVTSSSPFTNANTIGRLVVQQNSGAVNIVLVNNTNDAYTYLINDGTAFKIQNSYNSTAGFKPITFSASGSENMRIDTSGNLLVGVTSTAFASTGGFAAFPGSQGGGSTSFNTHGNWSAFGVTTGATGTETAIKFYFGTTPTVVGSITVTSSLTAYNVSSDYRLKENIVPLTNALEKIALLKPSLYNYKSDPSTPIEGFIAHELQTVVPHAVTGEKDAVDKDGNPDYQGVDVSFLVPHLVAAIQEQQAMITTLQTQVTALQAKG